MTIPPLLHRITAAQPYPLLFAEICGAHLYGFASPDFGFGSAQGACVGAALLVAHRSHDAGACGVEVDCENKPALAAPYSRPICQRIKAISSATSRKCS